MQDAWNRRTVLGGAGAGLMAAVGTPLSLPGVLQGQLPAPLQALLPADARGALDLVGELLKLEQEAKLLQLPLSKLAFGNGAIPTSPGQLYELAMPRLVALVDRSEAINPAFADKAGGLLARLHRTQYDVPAAWQSSPSAALSLRPADEEPGLARAEIELPNAIAPTIEAVLPPISSSLKFAALADEYLAWFAAAQIRPEHQDSARWHLTMMRESRGRYQALSKQVGVPWQFIAAIHGLEASFNFRAHLHNGDFPLSLRTRQVPSGRPRIWAPPSSWEASAVDALQLMGFTGQSDWSVARMLYRLEAYNGFGYRNAARASPYLWSFSTLYSRGKFVSDGHFDPRARSQQCGAAVMLKLLDLGGELA